MDFEAVFRLLIENFQKQNIRFALIGGFALQAAGYARATGDIDFLVAKEDMPKVKAIMLAHEYDVIHESQDVSNFRGRLAPLGRVDFLHAHRTYARGMLEQANETEILGGLFKVLVIRPEDLIGLKVQSSSNDPSRSHQDTADIEEVIRANRNKLDMGRVQEYFRLFKREAELKQILGRIGVDG